MKWLEVIRVRASAGKRDTIVAAVFGATAACRRSGEPRICIYRHHSVANDLSVHLHHESSGQAPRASALALHLVAAASELGLTEHSLWIEATEEVEP